MAPLDKHNRSKDEVTETLEARNLEEGKNNSTTSLNRLPLVSGTFTFLALSAVMGLCYVLFAERFALSSMVTLPLSFEPMGPRIDSMQVLNSQGLYCLLESSLEAIQERVKNGDSVAMQLKGYTDNQFVAIAMDQTKDQCFLNAEGRQVCVLPSVICGEEFPLVPRSRNLEYITDEEYDIRCQAYIASNPPGWDDVMFLLADCADSCQGLLGCPCICFNEGDPIPPDFVVPDDFVPRTNAPNEPISDPPLLDPTSAPSDDPTRRPNPCRNGNGKKLCNGGPHH